MLQNISICFQAATFYLFPCKEKLYIGYIVSGNIVYMGQAEIHSFLFMKHELHVQWNQLCSRAHSLRRD